MGDGQAVTDDPGDQVAAEIMLGIRLRGIAPELQGRVFEEFYQIDNPERDRAKGLGLGLALVRSIAGRHHGSVHCEDHAGGGACFVLRLPLRKGSGGAA